MTSHTAYRDYSTRRTRKFEPSSESVPPSPPVRFKDHWHRDCPGRGRLRAGCQCLPPARRPAPAPGRAQCPAGPGLVGLRPRRLAFPWLLPRRTGPAGIRLHSGWRQWRPSTEPAAVAESMTVTSSASLLVSDSGELSGNLNVAAGPGARAAAAVSPAKPRRRQHGPELPSVT